MKRPTARSRWIAGIVSLCAVCCAPFSALAQERTLELTIITETSNRVQVTLGQSALVRTDRLISRISLAEPKVADSILLSARQVSVIGKAIGKTSLTLWDSLENVSILDIEVMPDVVRLKERLNDMLPEEPIRVHASHDGVTLYGTVSSSVVLHQALAVAELFAPEKVVNLMQVSGVHQVMLEVRVAEMSSTLTKRLGVNFGAIASGNFFGVSLLNNLISIPPDPPAFLAPFDISSSVNSLLRFNAGGVAVTGFLEALKEDGLAKVLAEPTLVTLSGQEARFLAGGEFPFTVPYADGTVTIEFRSFGVALSFTPTVLSPDKISIQVAPEVSELDFANSVTLGGTTVPSLTIRRASTTIELADGQSFAVAGLLQERIREVISKFPVLGEIPVLGALFRSSSFERGETELIIIVTPRLVKPLDVAKQTLPTDGFVEPNDIDFFLFGKLQGKGGTHGRWGKFDGAFGYISSPQGAVQP
ncbi:MAG: hypothetical protein ETSY1_00435 [Candidatus Entotheonella factor]|uniref:Uncharacterized protein n=1 Tax=Entotheonella factor TaxID=1429438 RepID=W4M0Y1_ENTF1|nr:MAG: hypothetical protein ETSY1_00435 [Candidatus Entotheonella factor]